MFDKLRSWLRGEYTCRKCGKTYFSLSFGTGEMICPECYKGEQPFIFPERNLVVFGSLICVIALSVLLFVVFRYMS